MKSGFYQKDGVKIHYYYHYHQNRETVVLLHGYLDSAQTFKSIFWELKKKFNLIAVDIPGFGYSNLPPIRLLWHIPNIGQLVAYFLNSISIKDTICIGHSLGGGLSFHIQEFSKKKFNLYPFKKFHLIAPSIQKHPERDRIKNLMFPRSRDDVKTLLHHLYSKDAPELSGLLLDGLLRYSSKVGFYYLSLNTVEREDECFFAPKRLKQFKKPIRLYWSDDDMIIPIGLGKKLRQSLPSAKLFKFSKAGHTLHLKQRDEFLRHLEQN
jgi:pimeloyl-ACP methyl ester carboxylesterase